MATDMLVHAFRNNFDTLILVSGDTDFADALQAVKEQGKHTEVALFGGGRSSQRLRDISDVVVSLDTSFFEGCWL